MKSRQRLPVVLAAILVLSTTSIFAIRWGLASVYAWQAQTRIDQWVSNNSRIDLADWQQSESRLLQATTLDPQNASYLQSLGVVYEWRARLKTSDFLQQRHDLQQSLQWYRRALARRPHSGYVWANLFAVKARLGQFDDELRQALDSAVSFARHETAVQTRIADAGLAIWNRLSPDEQDQVATLIEQGFRNDSAAMIRLVDASGLRGNVCGLVTMVGNIRTYCSQ